MTEYLELCKTNDVPEGSMKGFELEGQKILVANVEGEFYAMDAVCSHMKGYLPSGKLRGKIVKCPSHGCKYDVTSGKVVKNVDFMTQAFSGKCHDQQIFEITTKGDTIFIKL